MDYNPIGEIPPGRGLEIEHVTAKWIPPNAADLVQSYVNGTTELALSRQYGVSRGAIGRVLSDHGVARRGITEMNRINMAKRTPAQRAKNVAAAHAAVRGVPKDWDFLCRRAAGVEHKGRLGADERQVSNWLSARGVLAVPQKAIGPYNCDLAIGSVAVEIFGGHFHQSGRHRARWPERSRYISNQGWSLVVVWNTTHHALHERLADELVALSQIASSDPSSPRQHRVIWGCGEVTVTPAHLDQFTHVPAGSTRCRFGA